MNDQVQKTCPTCGVAYCLPARFDAERREDHATWWCPNGHPLHYPQESPKDQRIRELEATVARQRGRLERRDRTIDDLKREIRSLRSRLAWARRRAA